MKTCIDPFLEAVRECDTATRFTGKPHSIVAERDGRLSVVEHEKAYPPIGEIETMWPTNQHQQTITKRYRHG